MFFFVSYEICRFLFVSGKYICLLTNITQVFKIICMLVFFFILISSVLKLTLMISYLFIILSLLNRFLVIDLKLYALLIGSIIIQSLELHSFSKYNNLTEICSIYLFIFCIIFLLKKIVLLNSILLFKFTYKFFQ